MKKPKYKYKKRIGTVQNQKSKFKSRNQFKRKRSQYQRSCILEKVEGCLDAQYFTQFIYNNYIAIKIRKVTRK